MPATTEDIIRIASEEFRKLAPEASGVDVEELEEDASSGHFFVTLGYCVKDSKPTQTAWEQPGHEWEKSRLDALLNPWRRKFKRVEIDPAAGRAIAIKMYEPPLGVS